MISWDKVQEIYANRTGDQSSEGLTQFLLDVNVCYKNILNEFERPDTEKTITTATVAAQRGYQLPVDAAWVKSVTVRSGSRVYPLVEEVSQDKWNFITSVDIQSAVQEIFFVKKRFGLAGQVVELDPIPSGTTSTIKIVYEPTDRDLQYSAYTTGTIALTNGSEVVTGTGTTFVTRMAGQYITTTDGLYYKIAQYSSPTSLLLENVYLGSTEAAATYGIHDLFNIPEDMHPIPVYYGLMEYYGGKENPERQGYYERRYTMLFKQSKARYGTKSRGIQTHNIAPGAGAPTYPRYFPTTMGGID